MRRIGRSELSVAPVMLGGNTLGWTADRAASFEVLDAFVDAGLNAIDTAEVYSQWVPGHVGGESETMIGEWLKSRGRRDDVVLATKVGGRMPGWERDLSAAYLVEAVEGSLRRLQTNHIDLYQSHMDDADTPLEETLSAYDQLIRAGKVRAIGASHFTADRLLDALQVSEREGTARYECLQPRFNLIERSGYEEELRDVCLRHGLGVIGYSALAKGFLSGRYRTVEQCETSEWRDPLLGYLDPRGRRVLAALDAVAQDHGATPAEVALAWVIAQPGVTAAIVAVKTANELGQLLGATRITLDPAQLDLLDSAADTVAPPLRGTSRS
jgi:aryl-alcohol dehydrogenase-like predicted oxidoreductase